MNDSKSYRLSAPGVWEKVLSLLGDIKGLSILDAPAGSGSLSEAIMKQGGIVTPLDINPLPDSFKTSVKADLNQRLPFEDNTFDRVVCVEGIEHIENPAFLLREYARVLKKNGELVISTPNIQNIRSRLKFLLTGVTFWFGKRAITRHGHITPVSIYYLTSFSEKAGFHEIKLHVNRRHFWMQCLALPVRIAGALFGEAYNTLDLLAGEILVLKMKKH